MMTDRWKLNAQEGCEQFRDERLKLEIVKQFTPNLEGLTLWNITKIFPQDYIFYVANL